MQVTPLGGGHPRRGRQRVKHLHRRPHRPTLLQVRVIGDGHVGKQCDFLAPQDDELIDAGQREQIRAALAAAAVDHELVSYPGVGHAFFWPGTPPYSQAARDDSWRRIVELLAT